MSQVSFFVSVALRDVNEPIPIDSRQIAELIRNQLPHEHVATVGVGKLNDNQTINIGDMVILHV